MNRYFFVVNPKSSSGATTKLWQRIYPQLLASFPQMEYAFTQSSGHGSLLTEVALREGFNRIIAVGGDGTNGELVNGFFKAGLEEYHDAAIGFVPAGTGNDFCRSIGAPEAKVDDGDLELVMIGELGKGEFLWNFPKVYFGQHKANKKVKMCAFQRLEITSEKRLALEMDGEVFGHLPAEVKALPHSIQVILP
ncbi:MAG: diacylglycerol/lipid kinase family protein [Oligoflexus sp.]